MMQRRHDLFTKISLVKENIKSAIKTIVSYRNSQNFEKKIPTIISQFDIIFKQIASTIPINAESKPIPLKEFHETLRKKTENQKDNILNRYSKEIQQINSKFHSLSKEASSIMIQFIEDSNFMQKRFERQLLLKNKTCQESMEILKKSMVIPHDEKYWKDFYQTKKSNEEDAIIKKRKDELLTITIQIEQTQSQIQEISQPNESFTPTNQSKLDFLKQTFSNDLSIIEKQIQFSKRNYESRKESLAQIQESIIQTRESCQRKFTEFKNTLLRQHQETIQEKQVQIASIEAQINSYKESMAPETDYLDRITESTLEEERNRRNAKIQEEEDKRKEFESIILSKLSQYYEIINENCEIEKQIQSQNEKLNQSKQIMIDKLRNEQKAELDGILNDLQQYRDYHSKLSRPISDLFNLQKFLDDTIIQTKKIELFDHPILNDKIDFSPLESEFSEMSDFIFKEEIKLQHQLNLLEQKVNGFFSGLSRKDLDFSEEIQLQHQINMERQKIDLFERYSEFEFNNIQKFQSLINPIETFHQINRIRLSLFSFKIFFELIEDLNIHFVPNDDGINFLEKMKFQVNELKQRFDAFHNKFNELLSLESYSDFFDDYVSTSNDFKQFEEEQLKQIQRKNIHKGLFKFTKKFMNDLDQLKQTRNIKFSHHLKLLQKLIERETLINHNSYLMNLQRKNAVEEEFLKQQIEIAKLMFLNEENDLKFIHSLELDIKQLETASSKTTPQSHLHRKRCLPPLKDL